MPAVPRAAKSSSTANGALLNCPVKDTVPAGVERLFPTRETGSRSKMAGISWG